MALKSIIFDMDGVLTDTIEYHFRSWEQAFQTYGIPFTRQDNETLRGLTRRRSLEVVLGNREMTEEDKTHLLQLKNSLFLEMIKGISQEDLLPGALALLKEAKEAGLLVGVASGSSNAAEILQRLGVAGYIDALCDGRCTDRSKPAPDVFLQVAERLGVKPQDCLVVEDSQAGVQAAIQAGMCVIGIDSPERTEAAYATFHSLSQVHVNLLKAIYELWCAQPPARWAAALASLAGD